MPKSSKMSITYAIAAAVLGLAVSSTFISTALADSPHFISASSGLSGFSLTCTFKEAGLGNLGFSSIQETCSALATAQYICVNNGGNHPQAANKETVTAPVTGGGNFPIRNGQTTGTITVPPPGPGSFKCPGGQHLELSFVSYTNVKICDALGNCVNLSPQSKGTLV